MCSGLKWSNDQHHVYLLHVCRPYDYMACRACGHMCLERCARSGVPPLAKPIRGFFAATVHFGRFLLSLPFARPRPQNRWHPWRIANRSLHHARVLYGLPLSRLTELHHTSMFCVASCFSSGAPPALGSSMDRMVYSIRLSRLGCADRP